MRVLPRREAARTHTLRTQKSEKSEGRYGREGGREGKRRKRFPLRSTRNKRKERRNLPRGGSDVATGVDRLGPSFAFGSVFCGAGQEGSVLKTNERSR